MGNETGEHISSLLSGFPEPALLVSGRSGDFFVEAVYGGTSSLWNVDLDRDEPLPVFEFLQKSAGESTLWDRPYLNQFLHSITDSQKPATSGIVEIHLNTDPGNKFLQLVGSHVPGTQDGATQLFLIIRDVSDAVHFGVENRRHNNEDMTRSEWQNKSDSFQELAVKNRVRFDTASQELDDFLYSVSHDLRAPLRRIDGFSQELIESYLDKMDETGQHYLHRIRQGAQDMGNLIDDLLKLSRISRREVERSSVNIGEIARTIFEDLKSEIPERDIELITTGNLKGHADHGLLKIVLTNLLSNAIKFTRHTESASIEVGAIQKDGQKTWYVKDNGTGFDPAYSDKLFKAFQRLHSQHEYEGTGIGLVTVKRIINSHNGKIWAEGALGKGALFYFTLAQETLKT